MDDPMLLDPDLFATLERIRTTAHEKKGFSPSPGMQQAVMAQAQGGGGMPPGGDPAAAGGMPPGGNPAAAGGAPPPGDPAMGAPPPDAATPSMPSPEIAEIKQMLMQLTQGQGGQGGAMGPNGKPATASLKFEPQHFHTLVHKINSIEAVLTQMADQFGLQVPASELLGQTTAPGALPGQDPAAGGAPGAAPAPGGAPPAGGQPGGGVAQQLPSLPSLPPAAAKAAAALDVARSPVDVERLGRLGTGFVVGGADSPKGGSPTTKLAAFVARRSF